LEGVVLDRRRPRGLICLVKVSARVTFSIALALSLFFVDHGIAQATPDISVSNPPVVKASPAPVGRFVASDDCHQLAEKIHAHELSGQPFAACSSFGTAGTIDRLRQNDIIPAPDWCTIDSFKYTRTGACGVSNGEVKVYDTQTGVVVGGITYGGLVYEFTDARVTNWQLEITLSAFNFWGAGAEGTTFQATGNCNGDCTTGKQSWPTQLITRDSTYEGYVSGDSTATASGAIGSGVLGVTVTATNPLWAAPTTSRGNAPAVRCDNALPGRGPGCVFNTFTPQMTYSLSGSYPELAAHIRDAQASGLPGGTVERALHRTTNDVLQQKNNSTACPRSLPRPPGKDCDEYPFKSTYEGAASNPFSARMIDSRQNQQGGNELGQFMGNNRVLDHDPFTVVVTP
jgi:hypothetical protein